MLQLFEFNFPALSLCFIIQCTQCTQLLLQKRWNICYPIALWGVISLCFPVEMVCLYVTTLFRERKLLEKESKAFFPSIVQRNIFGYMYS